MEGKTVILSVFIMSFIIAQIQVEAKSCCPVAIARTFFDTCRAAGASEQACASATGCKIISGTTCPPGFPLDILKNSGDVVNEYCKLGCVSSVCSALNTLQNPDASEIVNGAIDQCTKACSIFCTKTSITAVKTA